MKLFERKSRWREHDEFNCLIFKWCKQVLWVLHGRVSDHMPFHFNSAISNILFTPFSDKDLTARHVTNQPTKLFLDREPKYLQNETGWGT